ncbi:MAG: cation diffusion facilitator family transporter [Nitrospirota bacterium]
MDSKKVRWARLSVASNSLLVCLKIAVGLATGSVSILAEGLHSAVDLAASIITALSVRIATKGPDKRHPYGHGKFENAAGAVEGALIILGAALIVNEAVPKLLHGGHEIDKLSWGVGVMALSAVINGLVSAKLFKVSKETCSPALAADGWHLRTDVYTSAGVLGGLILIKLTKNPVFDPILALLVAVFIFIAGLRITKEAFSNLVDVSPPEAEVIKVREAIGRHDGQFVEYHGLRVRKSGGKDFIDLHLVMPGDLNLSAAHEICTAIESELERELSDTDVTIHPEPCDYDCKKCRFQRTGSGLCGLLT